MKQKRIVRHLPVAGLVATMACVVCVGCAPNPPQGSRANATEGGAESSGPAWKDAPGPSWATVTDLDQWTALYLQGAKVGYGHLRIHLVDGRRVLSGLNTLEVTRFGERATQEIRLNASETREGHLLDFRLSVSMGTEETTTEGKVEGDRLLITTQTRGKTTRAELPWSPEIGGFYAVEESLLAKPMKPGESRTLKGLVLGFNGIADIRLSAEKMETVDVLTSTQELLRIEKTVVLPDTPPVQETSWTDEVGQILKSRVALFNLESFLVPKGEALREGGEAEFDLGTDVSVPLAKPLADPRGAARLAWRVTLEDKNPAKVFPSGPFQSVKGVDDRTAIVDVRSARSTKIADKPPTSKTEAKYIEPSAFIQSDAEAIKKLASEAIEGHAGTWEKAKALERFAHDYITETNFSQAFSSAAEVCETRQGDCTEHAVFLAALARAVGIPSRVAVGLVYMEGASAFGYHMWTEVRIGDTWVPLDATLGLGGAGATHLKLADTALEGGTPFGQFLTLLETAGKLQIRLEE